MTLALVVARMAVVVKDSLVAVLVAEGMIMMDNVITFK